MLRKISECKILSELEKVIDNNRRVVILADNKEEWDDILRFIFSQQKYELTASTSKLDTWLPYYVKYKRDAIVITRLNDTLRLTHTERIYAKESSDIIISINRRDNQFILHDTN
jgi:hypothetical protein